MNEPGTGESFEAFFQRTYPHLMARAILLDGHRQDDEDAVAEAYAIAAARWDLVSRYDSPEAYVQVTMVRLVRKAAKRRRRQESVALELPGSPYATAEQALEVKQVLAALAKLTDAQRTVVVLCCLEGRPQAEVARLLRITRSTVAAHLFNARKALAARFGRVPVGRQSGGQSGDALVPVGRLTVTDPAGAVHRWLADTLRDTELRLTEAFQADPGTETRIRAGIGTVTNVERAAHDRRRWWRRVRRGDGRRTSNDHDAA